MLIIVKKNIPAAILTLTNFKFEAFKFFYYKFLSRTKCLVFIHNMDLFELLVYNSN